MSASSEPDGPRQASPARGALAQDELRALLDAAVDAIIMIDHAGTVLIANGAAERLFGHRIDDMLRRNISMLMPEDMATHHDGHLARYHRTREPHVIGVGRDVVAKRRDGSEFPARLSVGVVPGTDPPCYVGFIHDLSSRRSAEEESRRSQERLAQVSRFAAMGEMAAGISHELNQPLAAIATYAQACDRMLGSDRPDLPEIQGALKQISAQALRAGEIIRRLRHMVGNRETERLPVEMNEVVLELGTLARTDLSRHRIDLRFDLMATAPTLSIDRVQVQQVLLNLLRNAMEALGQDPAADREIIVGTRPFDDGGVEVTVTDHGPGVSREAAEQMFDPFFTTKRDGTGLGLAISRTIARAHHGTLGHRAAPGGGAQFYLQLPALEPSA
jgi:two-component system, LuxR family, sensor kinase FixL